MFVWCRLKLSKEDRPYSSLFQDQFPSLRVHKHEATGGGGTPPPPPPNEDILPLIAPPPKKNGNRNQESYHLSKCTLSCT